MKCPIYTAETAAEARAVLKRFEREAREELRKLIRHGHTRETAEEYEIRDKVEIWVKGVA